MDAAWMARQLPECCPKELISWAIEHHGEKELGGEFVVFNSERIKLENGKTEWVAYCTCTACKEEFITQKEPGERAIRLILGEDGSYYTTEPGDAVDPYMGIELQREGDDFYCPICGSKVELIHKSSISGGRTKRMLVIQLVNVEGYTALVYWMVQRHLTEFGGSTYAASPEDAFVLTEAGGLKRFTHIHRHGYFYGCNRSDLGCWKPMQKCEDTIDSRYPDWRSSCSQKVGGDIWPVYPNMDGSTGEKTAIEEFFKAGGYRGVQYLKWWRTQRNVENLMRQGQAKLVVSLLREAYRYSTNEEIEARKVLDLSKTKPHEILRLTKEEFRWVRTHQLELDMTRMAQWCRYKKANGKLGAPEFFELAYQYGNNGMTAAMWMLEEYGHDIDKTARYLRKRNYSLTEAPTLSDTRRALRELYNRPLTDEELWPKHLHQMHDRTTAQLQEIRREKDAEKSRQQFRAVVDDYGHLCWTDGELCVRLPESSADLKREGDVLRHCVGGYSASHVGRTSVIFFIRHYRRPERPYYTLAIDMSRGKPKECQLHGYGNERHGKHKEYSHSIPKKVRAFCDRWENEILLPWYAQEQARKQKEAKTA